MIELEHKLVERGPVLTDVKIALMEQPDIRRVIVMGPPGSGKTTAMRNLYAWAHKTLPVTEIRQVYFDSIRRQYLNWIRDYLGIEVDTVAKVPPEHLPMLSEMIDKEVLAPPEKDTLMIVELPSVGKYPLGQDTVKKLGKSGSKDTLYMMMIPDNRLIDHSKQIRGVGLLEHADMAQPSHIDRIIGEYREAVDTWLATGIENAVAQIDYISRLLPFETSIEDVKRMASDVAYASHLLNIEFGLPNNNCFVIPNVCM